MANRIIRQSRSFGGAVRSRGRLTEWLASANVTGATTLPAASFVLTQSLSAAELAKRPFTITRMVGQILVRSDQFAAREFPFGAVGGIVVSAKASTTGATAVPDPITEEGSDEWFMYQSWGVHGVNSASEPPLMAYPFDSRAQRKVQDGDDIVIVVANASAAFGVDFVLKFRMLVKLS